ncbi:MAG: hypothetical protein ACRDRO_12115, partial [Pseudonocardiaceae bacterium]
GDQAIQSTGDRRPGDGADQRAQCGIGRSIRPGAPVPATVLVAALGDGALLLHGWRTGPSAYLTAEDATPVHHALAEAFGADMVRTEQSQP